MLNAVKKYGRAKTKQYDWNSGRQNSIELDVQLEYGTLITQSDPHRTRNTDKELDDKRLLVQSDDPMVVPTIDEQEFIERVAGERPPTEISSETGNR